MMLVYGLCNQPRKVDFFDYVEAGLRMLVKEDVASGHASFSVLPVIVGVITGAVASTVTIRVVATPVSLLLHCRESVRSAVTGVALSVVVSSPSSPLPLSPQHRTLPSLISAPVWTKDPRSWQWRR